MKPKPFASLNHFTVPVSIRILETEKNEEIIAPEFGAKGSRRERTTNTAEGQRNY
jgi:hypothetical protein